MATTTDPKVSLILPCFNEIEHIAVSLKKIEDHMLFVFGSENFELILVDDGSADGTREWLQKREKKNIKVILNPQNLGRGGAVRVGMKAARGTVVGFMDIDCEVSEDYLPKFVQIIEEGNDFCIGLRIYRVQPNPYIVLRHLLSLGYKRLLKSLLKIKIIDTEVGYKFFSRRAKELALSYSQFDDWFWDAEVSYLMEESGGKIVEEPVAFLRNPQKTSTVRLIPDIVKYLKCIRLFKNLQLQGKYQDLKSFYKGT